MHVEIMIFVYRGQGMRYDSVKRRVLENVEILLVYESRASKVDSDDSLDSTNH